MGPELELLEWRGHRYDVRVLAAPMEYVHMRAQADAAIAAGARSGVEAMFAMEWQEVAGHQRLSLHGVTRQHPDGVVCSCSLTVPHGLPLERATGHLDLQTWDPADTFVVAQEEPGARFGEFPSRGRAACQRCGWLGALVALAAARQDATRHACGVETS